VRIIFGDRPVLLQKLQRLIKQVRQNAAMFFLYLLPECGDFLFVCYRQLLHRAVFTPSTRIADVFLQAEEGITQK
jgi:hypothetical protein